MLDEANELLPNVTQYQYRLQLLAPFFNQLAILDHAGERVGTWSSLWFPLLFSSFSLQGVAGPALEASVPWWSTFSMGASYTLTPCRDSPMIYSIEEDYWGVPWLTFWAEKRYHIRHAGTGCVIATAYYRKIVKPVDSRLLWLLSPASWHVTVADPSGEILATIDQDSQWQASWSYPKWLLRSQRSKALPREVLSFLVAVSDIDVGSKYGLLGCVLAYKFVFRLLRSFVALVV